MIFMPAIEPPTDISEPVLWFAFRQYDLLVYNNKTSYQLPQLINLQEIGLQPNSTQYLGKLGEQHCFSADMPKMPAPPKGMRYLHLRRLFQKLPDPHFQVALSTVQVVDWDRHNQFCGRCGTPMKKRPPERVKACPNCQLTRYPRYSPAIIVAVIKDGDKILLANHRRYASKLYTVLAGFVEPGETAEEAVHREIREEVGLKVKNVRYFGSQPWPFPDSLMLAFIAEYAGGELSLEDEEIAHADWFTADNLPQVPPRGLSVSRGLIDWFVESNGTL